MVTSDTAEVSVDLDHGGRWTTLCLGGREWLWHRDEPRRARVAPGDPFADAGGIEECVPTVRGRPDHGDAWSRPWRAAGDGAGEVACDDFMLRRVITADGGRVTARYRLSAAPGYRFIWAAHALLDVSPEATLHVQGSAAVRLYPEAAAFLDWPWPPGVPFLTVPWPGPGGLRLNRLGPDDGSAVGAIITGRAQVIIRDGRTSLRMALNDSGDSPTSIALWRNLGGFPESGPYRSVGVEPMLGSVFDLAEARAPGDAVTVPGSGYVEWQLEIS